MCTLIFQVIVCDSECLHPLGFGQYLQSEIVRNIFCHLNRIPVILHIFSVYFLCPFKYLSFSDDIEAGLENSVLFCSHGHNSGLSSYLGLKKLLSAYV